MKKYVNVIKRFPVPGGKEQWLEDFDHNPVQGPLTLQRSQSFERWLRIITIFVQHVVQHRFNRMLSGV